MKTLSLAFGAWLCFAVPSHAVMIAVLVDEPHEFSGTWESGSAPYGGHARADGAVAPFSIFCHGESVGHGRGALSIQSQEGAWGRGAMFSVDGGSLFIDDPAFNGRKWTYDFTGSYEPLDQSWAGTFTVHARVSSVPDSGAPLALALIGLAPMARWSRFRQPR